MSVHNLRGDPSTPSVKCWPRHSKFVTNGIECAVYMNGFGPEGGFHLGSCEHIYHPMYLIRFIVICRRCALCKAPFHKHLYELFGLVLYMPISWEYNSNNTPCLCDRWGDDLGWSWQLHDHSYNKSNISSQFRWKNETVEIVMVCQRLLEFLEITTKEKEISSTNALVAIGMREIRDSNLDSIQMDLCGMKQGSVSITAQGSWQTTFVPICHCLYPNGLSTSREKQWITYQKDITQRL